VLEGAGLRKLAERAGVDRKTARRYVVAAEAAGLKREAGVEVLSDERSVRWSLRCTAGRVA